MHFFFDAGKFASDCPAASVINTETCRVLTQLHLTEFLI